MSAKKLVFASTRPSGGKTSVILGLAAMLQGEKKIGYLKPFGDRLSYRKKRLWDFDSALMIQVFGLDELPEDMSIGFSHSKIMFMYDEGTTKDKLRGIAEKTGADKDILFIEGGKELSYGASVFLDPMAIAETLDAGLVIIVSGQEGGIIDDLTVMKMYLDRKQLDLKGVIINKIPDVQDFKELYMPTIKLMDIPILGVIPYERELTTMTMGFLANHLFAKVLAGQDGMDKIVQDVFVGALSVSAAIQSPHFSKPNKLIITPGDREDMIVAALESDTSGIILTHNILPSSHIIAKAAQANIPLLLVPYDTIKAAREIDHLEPLLTKDDDRKKEIVTDLVKRYVDVDKILR